MIEPEILLYVGDEDASFEFFSWAETRARIDDGWMTIVLLQLNSNRHDGTLLWADHSPPTDLLQALHGAGLTYGVMLAHYIFDDETQFYYEAASHLGMKRVAVGGRKTFHRLEDGINIDVRDTIVVVRDFPFRMKAWQPLAEANGHPKPSSVEERRALYDETEAIWPKSTGKRRSRR
jgi:hypothetical protein